MLLLLLQASEQKKEFWWWATSRDRSHWTRLFAVQNCVDNGYIYLMGRKQLAQGSQNATPNGKQIQNTKYKSTAALRVILTRTALSFFPVFSRNFGISWFFPIIIGKYRRFGKILKKNWGKTPRRPLCVHFMLIVRDSTWAGPCSGPSNARAGPRKWRTDPSPLPISWAGAGQAVQL